jgi:hypothetical protein
VVVVVGVGVSGSGSGSRIEAAGRLNNNGKFPFLELRIGLRLVVSRLGGIDSAVASTPHLLTYSHALTRSTLLVRSTRNTKFS